MRLSRKADYALRVMLSLVGHKDCGPISISDLAKENDVPKRFLEQIMLALKSQGWVASTRGRTGGYVLALPADQITLGQIIRHFDGVAAPIGCLSISSFEPCTQSATCRFRRVLLDIRNLTAAHLDSATLARVTQNEPVADLEVFRLGTEGLTG
jgi:Rrf2 family protein